ncbi:hypothetical protein ACGYK3_13935 [Sulfitobacter sp. 1A05707]|uniref:hypothetical protein n=1 Tax=Sulfitobacter sp. 1A05707 TaxID=3368560 RepID=UPI003744B32D
MNREFAVGLFWLKHDAVDQAAQCVLCLEHTVGVLKLPDQRSDPVAIGLCQFRVYPDGRRGRIAFHLRLKFDAAGIQSDHLVFHLLGRHARDDGIDQLYVV